MSSILRGSTAVLLVTVSACFIDADIKLPPLNGDSGEDSDIGLDTDDPTHTDDPDTDRDSDTDTDIDTDTDTDDPSMDPATCFYGVSRQYDTCVPLTPADPQPSGYEYPPPYQGSTQYRAPVAWLDLEETDPALRVAPNFQLQELASAEKGPFGVVQPHVVETLQNLRDELGAIVVSSGYRSPAYNAGIGGATSSRHIYGDGFDLIPQSASFADLANACVSYGAGYVSVYEAHIHCDWRNDPLDEDFYGLVSSFATPNAPRPAHDATLIPVGDGSWSAPATGWDEGEPRRQWVALDADDVVIRRHTGRTFRPPPGTSAIEVDIGGQLVRRQNFVE